MPAVNSEPASERRNAQALHCKNELIDCFPTSLNATSLLRPLLPLLSSCVCGHRTDCMEEDGLHRNFQRGVAWRRSTLARLKLSSHYLPAPTHPPRRRRRHNNILQIWHAEFGLNIESGSARRPHSASVSIVERWNTYGLAGYGGPGDGTAAQSMTETCGAWKSELVADFN